MSDVLLPDADGRTLVSALTRSTAHIPILWWTARYRQAERDAALDLDAEDLIEKGPAAALEGKIASILQRFSERIPVG